MASGTRQRLPLEERRALIVDAALEEFAARGYEAASMGRIAEAAGVTRSVMYDHFPSKRALFATLLEAQHARLLEQMRAALNTGAPLKRRMRDVLAAFLGFAQDEPAAWSLLFPDHPPSDADVAQDQRLIRADADRTWAEALAPDLRAAGLDPGAAGMQAVLAIHQAALAGAARWHREQPDVPFDVVVGATMDALWAGIRGLGRR